MQVRRREFLKIAVASAAALVPGCKYPRSQTMGSRETAIKTAYSGCYDRSQQEALAAYTRAISSQVFREKPAFDIQGRPILISGQPIIGQIPAAGNQYDPKTYTDICGNQFEDPEAFYIYRMQQHKHLTGKNIGVGKVFAFFSYHKNYAYTSETRELLEFCKKRPKKYWYQRYNNTGAFFVQGKMTKEERNELLSLPLTRKDKDAIRKLFMDSQNATWLSMPTKILNAIHRQGAIPFLADTPMDCIVPFETLYLMKDITAGKWDKQIRQRARELRNLGYPIFYSWGHEMNGSWYPYGRTDLGNTPKAFAAAMRHVYNLYQEEGATNLLWVYSPNFWYPSSVCGISNTPAKCPPDSVDRFYPYPKAGEPDFIYLIAPHVYNWGTGTYSWGKSANLSFDQVANATFTALRSRHPNKPFGIGEMGTSSIGVDVRAWIKDAFSRMLEYPYNVSLFVYFNPPKDGLGWPYKSHLF